MRPLTELVPGDGGPNAWSSFGPLGAGPLDPLTLLRAEFALVERARLWARLWVANGFEAISSSLDSGKVAVSPFDQSLRARSTVPLLPVQRSQRCRRGSDGPFQRSLFCPFNGPEAVRRRAQSRCVGGPFRRSLSAVPFGGPFRRSLSAVPFGGPFRRSVVEETAPFDDAGKGPHSRVPFEGPHSRVRRRFLHEELTSWTAPLDGLSPRPLWLLGAFAKADLLHSAPERRRTTPKDGPLLRLLETARTLETAPRSGPLRTALVIGPWGCEPFGFRDFHGHLVHQRTLEKGPSSTLETARGPVSTTPSKRPRRTVPREGVTVPGDGSPRLPPGQSV